MESDAAFSSERYSTGFNCLGFRRVVASFFEIGTRFNELKKIPRVIGIAGGSSKMQAIFAALQASLVNILVTDHLTAKALLDKV